MTSRFASPSNLREKLPHGLCDFFDVGFQREVPRIEKLHGRVQIVPPESFRAWRDEIEVALSPDRERWRF